MTIVEAAGLILAEHGGPLHVRRIHEQIAARGLYQFNTPDPVGVVARKIRELTSEDPGCRSPEFVKVAPNTFALVRWAAAAEAGEDAFQESANELSADDRSAPPRPRVQMGERTSWYRDPAVAARAIAAAEHRCEALCATPLFERRRGGGLSYIEAHHLIPMAAQDDFAVTLDVTANIVALCPLCHALIHHAEASARSPLILRLLHDREGALRGCGLIVSDSTLLSYY